MDAINFEISGDVVEVDSSEDDDESIDSEVLNQKNSHHLFKVGGYFCINIDYLLAFSPFSLNIASAAPGKK